MMTCDAALARLWEFLDGELSDPDAEALRRHLAVCSFCYPAYRFDLAFLHRITRLVAVRGVAPPTLVARVREQTVHLR